MENLTRIEVARFDLKGLSLDEILEMVQVEQIEEGGMTGWYGVSNQEGIIAYFGTEEEALYYRLSFINRVLNG